MTPQHLYLCGPMSGRPDYNHPAFHVAAAELRAAGYRVTNPAENGLPPGTPWLQHMRLDIKNLADCDGLATLWNWRQSRGANLEVALAAGLGLPVNAVWAWITCARIAQQTPTQETAP